MNHSFEFSSAPASPFLLTCEHASNYIPPEFSNLGLSNRELTTSKDWNDPGAFELLKLLSDLHGASTLAARFSRLVIDPNRPLFGPSAAKNSFHAGALKTQLLVERDGEEEIISIPRNTVLNLRKEEEDRWNYFVKPYYEKGTSAVETLLEHHPEVTVVQVHSFFPSYNGNVRSTDIGVLHQRQDNFDGGVVIDFLRKNSDFEIGDNKPWSMEDADGGIFDVFHENPRVRLFAIEVNNKHLQDSAGQEQIAKLLAQLLKEVF